LEDGGGAGGLIAVVDGGGDALLFAYDGNGNVDHLLDASDGSVDAHYEYDAFGNIVFSAGGEASENCYRFSTEYIDDETGLIYYGYRYYEPRLGRWVNRDPIAEKGGFNLYALVWNHTTNTYDVLGLACGPDVTDFMGSEISRLDRYIENAPKKPKFPKRPLTRDESYLAAPAASASDLKELAWFASIVLKFNYSDQQRVGGKVKAGACCPSKECKGTMTLCGSCLTSDVPGNLMFGYAADKIGIAPAFRDIGADAAEVFDVPPDLELWENQEDILTFDVGRDLARGVTTSLCDAIHRVAGTSGGPSGCAASTAKLSAGPEIEQWKEPPYPQYLPLVIKP